MNPIQESKQELEASIRYAENAIVKANQTIESMATYQEQTGREKALQNQVGELKSECAVLAERIDQMKDAAFDDGNTIKELNERNDSLSATIQRLKEEQPTMPVIPKAVAIAIFREGVQHGVEAACTELEEQSIRIEESEYVGDFHVTFERRIDLDDELDLDWMRDKCGDYSEERVIDALSNLCADKEFECRIHGVDDQEEKKND